MFEYSIGSSLEKERFVVFFWVIINFLVFELFNLEFELFLGNFIGFIFKFLFEKFIKEIVNNCN